MTQIFSPFCKVPVLVVTGLLTLALVVPNVWALEKTFSGLSVTHAAVVWACGSCFNVPGALGDRRDHL